MAVGARVSVPGRWQTSTDSNLADCCRIDIDDPVDTGYGKYFHTHNIKDGATNKRTEYAHIGTPYRVEMSSVGGGDYTGETYWYGYVLCLDTNNTTNGYGVYVDQWHAAVSTAPAPGWALMSGPNGSGGFTTFFYLESSQEPGVGNVKVNLNTDIIGQCIDVIWQVKQDTRLASEGSTGILRLWFGPSDTPKYEWLNKQVSQPPPDRGDTFQQFFKFGGYPVGEWMGDNGVSGGRPATTTTP
jgi:hypothetical protein